MTSIPSLSEIILWNIVIDKILPSTTLDILCDKYHVQSIIKFLKKLHPTDLHDLLKDNHWYNSIDFCKSIRSIDFGKISYQKFAISFKFQQTGILAKRLYKTHESLDPQFVYDIYMNMTDDLRNMFLCDSFDVSDHDLRKLSEGKIEYGSIRTKEIDKIQKFVHENTPSIISEQKRNELVKELMTNQCLAYYSKTITVHIDFSENSAMLYGITLRKNDNDPNSIPTDVGIIFIEFNKKYIEIFCKEICDYEGFNVDGALCNSQAKLIDENTTTTPVFVYSVYEDFDPESFFEPRQLHIPKSTDIEAIFKTLVAVEVKFEKPCYYYDDSYPDDD